MKISDLASWILTLCLKGLSKLPLRILYGISDISWPFIAYIIRYRHNVVLTNLRNSFPDWDEKQIKNTSRLFYKNFCDVFFETIKMISMSRTELMKHIRYTNVELLNELHRKQKHIIVVAAHYANWEWLAAMSGYTPEYNTIAVYKPLQDKHFDRLMYRIRSQYGTDVVSMNNIIRVLSTYIKVKKLSLSLFVADQSPARNEIHHWIRFMEQDTPVYLGIEKLAQRFDIAVVFCHIHKTGRGQYLVEPKLVSDSAPNTQRFEITEKHTRMLEEMILENPSLWLWSHRRWKHSALKGIETMKTSFAQNTETLPHP